MSEGCPAAYNLAPFECLVLFESHELAEYFACGLNAFSNCKLLNRTNRGPLSLWSPLEDHQKVGSGRFVARESDHCEVQAPFRADLLQSRSLC
jgi:hypothetical protein